MCRGGRIRAKLRGMENKKPPIESEPEPSWSGLIYTKEWWSLPIEEAVRLENRALAKLLDEPEKYSWA